MPSHRGIGRIGWAAVVAALATSAGPAAADELKIRGGGTLHGEVVPVEGTDRVEVYTANNPRPYAFSRDQITTVAVDDGPLDAYLRRRGEVEATAEAQHAFGLWCEERGLSGPAQLHFAKAVELDEDHGPSQKKLGRVFFDGRWITHDERRQLQGLVKHDGRWITPEEKDDLDAMARLTQAQEGWARQIDILIRKLAEGAPADRAEASAQLRAIADPEAVVPLVNRLGREGVDLRLMLAEILSAIEDPIAGSGLAHRVVRDEDAQIRLATLNALARRQDPAVVPRLIRDLEHKDPDHVGRAAWALAGLGATEAVPKLVPKLVTTRQRLETVLVPSQSGGGMGISASFGSTPGPAFGFGGGPTIPVLTGPAVAPGAIAFGVQAVPVYQYAAQATALSLGGGPAVAAATPPVPTQVVRSYPHRNVEVLSALERLTGKNFGYDESTWNRWLRTEFRSPDLDRRPARTVPQP